MSDGVECAGCRRLVDDNADLAAENAKVKERDCDCNPTCCRCATRCGDTGAQLSCGCWTCSEYCWDAEAGPPDAAGTHVCPTTTREAKLRAAVLEYRAHIEPESRLIRDLDAKHAEALRIAGTGGEVKLKRYDCRQCGGPLTAGCRSCAIVRELHSLRTVVARWRRTTRKELRVCRECLDGVLIEINERIGDLAARQPKEPAP